MALTFAAMVGGLACLPIREAISDLKQSVGILADKMVTQSELEWRTQRSAEDRAPDGSVRSFVMPRYRGRARPRLRSYDQQFTDQQRQLDDVKQAQGNVYGARDILLDLRKRIERQRLSAGQMGSAAQ